MLTCIPELSLPLPSSAQEIGNLRDRVDAALKTLELLEAVGVELPPLEALPSEEERIANRAALSAHANGCAVATPASRPAVLHLQAMLDEYDQMAARSAAQIRTYVTNKLIEETTNNNPTVRIKALELLGKIGDVALFTERSVVTVQHKTSPELEQTIKSRLARIANLRATAEAVEDATPKTTATLLAEEAHD